MNVLVVTNMYPTEKNPFYGIFVKEQVESLRKEGVFVDVFFINGIESRLNYFTCIKNLIKQMKSNHYDIIHAHHSYCVFPIRFAKAMSSVKSPVILTFHEGEVHFPNHFSLNGADFVKRLVFSKRIKSAALKMVDLVIAVQKEMLKKLNFNGKFIVIPLALIQICFNQWNRKNAEKDWTFHLTRK